MGAGRRRWAGGQSRGPGDVEDTRSGGKAKQGAARGGVGWEGRDASSEDGGLEVRDALGAGDKLWGVEVEAVDRVGGAGREARGRG